MSDTRRQYKNLSPPPRTSEAKAIAIKEARNQSEIPKVISGGKGKVAEQILQVAFQHGIKVREDSDLAEILSAVDVDAEIPIAAFAAVAEILAHMYAINDEIKNKLNLDSEQVNPSSETPIQNIANELVNTWTDLKDNGK